MFNEWTCFGLIVQYKHKDAVALLLGSSELKYGYIHYACKQHFLLFIN